MAECHPVGFQWVMEAKARGAKIVHIDPRFTRTSAVADLHVPLRAGSDIAFLGGDRKSTRLNSSHANISYAVFCLKKKKLIKTCAVDDIPVARVKPVFQSVHG